jgi:hypothetical protein
MAKKTEDVLKQQKEDAARDRAQQRKAQQAVAPVAKAAAINGGTAVAAPDTRSTVEQYLDEIAPPGMAGHLTKFTKDGEFKTKDTEEVIGEDEDFICIADQTLVGWQRFNGPGQKPDRIMGLLFNGFVMPPSDDLSERDESTWELGLDGKPADPWKHTMYVVLQKVSTSELYTFTTDSPTGRSAVGNLLNHYCRMEKRGANEYPVIRLKKSGFMNKDPRVGWVNKPAFVVVGKTPKDSAAKPDTSPSGDMDDEIPF